MKFSENRPFWKINSLPKKLKEFILLLLLMGIGIIVRLQFTHQTDFDSYWIHGMSESINIYGYAQWVFHPASLFGYYPLSYPSGLMYFLSFFSEITGIGMNYTILIIGIFLGILGAILVFLIGRKIAGFFVGYLAALMFTLSPQIIYYSSWIASGRYLLIIFYLIFILFLMEILHLVGLGFDKDLSEHKKVEIIRKRLNKITLIKYISISLIIFIFLFMVHRTSQLTVLFIVAAFATYLFYAIPGIWKKLNNLKFINKFFRERYNKWNKWFIIDVTIVVAVLIIYKLADLIIRRRLLINIERRLTNITPLLSTVKSNIEANIIFAVLLLLLLIILVIVFIRYIKNIKRINVLDKIEEYYSKHHFLATKDLKKYFFRFLLVVAVILFVIQFFGGSFYSPSLEEYAQSDLLKGNNPLFIFLNFVLNYTTAVTIFTVFAAIGIVYLFLKHKKEPSDVFLIFITLTFIGILVDRRYIRLFITPILVLIAAKGLHSFYTYLKQKFNYKLLNYLFIFLIFIMIFASFVPQIREIYTEKNSVFPFKEQYWDTGQYIKNLNCNCSTITTQEQAAGVTIFASSGVPGGSHNIYYFVNKSYLEPNPIDYKEIVDKLKRGDKVTDLWYLPDWIFGGQYYGGRHTVILFNRDYRAKEAKRIVYDYNEEYYIHDKLLEENKFYNSITPVYNQVYDNPLIEVYHLRKGRALP